MLSLERLLCGKEACGLIVISAENKSCQKRKSNRKDEHQPRSLLHSSPDFISNPTWANWIIIDLHAAGSERYQDSGFSCYTRSCLLYTSQWTSTGTGYPRFGMLVHHTDEVREWAYDRTSHIGKLDKGLNDAPKYNWLIVDMKQDWKKVYGFE